MFAVSVVKILAENIARVSVMCMIANVGIPAKLRQFLVEMKEATSSLKPPKRFSSCQMNPRSFEQVKRCRRS